MSSVHAVLAHGEAILLDFDGPVCGIFANGINLAIADKLRAELTSASHDLPSTIAATHDPLAVLRYAAQLEPSVLAKIEDRLIAEELRASEQATPTAHAYEAIHGLHESGRLVVIVSNNSEPAIRHYLDHHGLTSSTRAVVGRAYARPELMKPDPSSVHRALAMLDAPPSACLLIGDSLTDIEVARATGVVSIGYTKALDRVDGLHNAGADAVTESMADIIPPAALYLPS